MEGLGAEGVLPALIPLPTQLPSTCLLSMWLVINRGGERKGGEGRRREGEEKGGEGERRGKEKKRGRHTSLQKLYSSVLLCALARAAP